MTTQDEAENVLTFAADVGSQMDEELQQLVVYEYRDNRVIMRGLNLLLNGLGLPVKIPRRTLFLVPPEEILQPEQVEDYRNELRPELPIPDEGEAVPTEIRRLLNLAAQYGRPIGMTRTEFQQHLIDVAEAGRRNFVGFRGVFRGELLPYFAGNDPHSMIQFKSVDSLTENERENYLRDFPRLYDYS